MRNNNSNFQFLNCLEEESKQIPQGLLYIPEDSYFSSQGTGGSSVEYLYTDGITSCVGVVITDNRQQVLAAHLASPESIDEFFNLAANRFHGPLRLWARGGNPPGNEPAVQNVCAFLSAVHLFLQPGLRQGIYTESLDIRLGSGHPLERNRDALGVDLKKRIITNRKYLLTPQQRDPSGGMRVLYQFFRDPQEEGGRLSPADLPLSDEKKKIILTRAAQIDWPEILKMSDRELLGHFSTTPDCEPCWFAEQIRQAARFAMSASDGDRDKERILTTD